jgi:hypothetical protein
MSIIFTIPQRSVAATQSEVYQPPAGTKSEIYPPEAGKNPNDQKVNDLNKFENKIENFKKLQISTKRANPKKE